MVLIEHDMPLLLGPADRVYALETGVVIAEGAPDEVVHDPEVVRSYLGTDAAVNERTFLARLFKSPRLIVLIATIGIAQLVIVARLIMPKAQGAGGDAALAGGANLFPVPFHGDPVEFGRVVLLPQHFMVLVAGPFLALRPLRLPALVGLRRGPAGGGRERVAGPAPLAEGSDDHHRRPRHALAGAQHRLPRVVLDAAVLQRGRGAAAGAAAHLVRSRLRVGGAVLTSRSRPGRSLSGDHVREELSRT
jgi:hypothetical protein